MPVLRCQKNGKRGYKFGNNGKCFTGSGARAKAAAQGAAIKIGQKSRRARRRNSGRYS